MSSEVNKPAEQRSFFASLIAKNPDAVVVKPKDVETTHESGMERLRKMYLLDQYGYRSKEMLMIIQNSTVSFLAGATIGAIMQSRETYVSFIENNHATKFANALDAKRLLQRQMYLAFIKGGWRWGWRIGIFSLTFTTVMTTISIYRGKESLLEYLIAGGVTGGVCKMNMGLKGAFAGSLVGTALGGIAGSFSLLLLKIGGTSLDEIRDISKHFDSARHEAMIKNQKDYMLEERAELINLPTDARGFENLKVEEETK